MLKVLWETGCRNDTLLNLKYKDLKKDDMMVFLKGKRGDERYVSMEKDLFNELYNWVKNNDLNKKKFYLFVNPDTQKPYSDTWLVSLVRDYT